MPRWKITLEYDGTPFDGWQRQPHGKGVQDYVERALAAFNTDHPKTIVAGRTDAGVHAVGQVIHTDLDRDMGGEKLCDALNAHLRPHPIVALMAEKVSMDFSARFDATQRHYRYIVLPRLAPAALLINRVWNVQYPLDLAAMQRAAQDLIGAHDFTSFRSAACQAKNPVRTLTDFTVTQHDDQIWFECSARAFLHHQVRNMVGTLVEIGRGLRPADDIPRIFAAQNRAAAGVTAPAGGLYFMRVDYELSPHQGQ
jgi:tRNA pseudouridine38-40 synthase